MIRVRDDPRTPFDCAINSRFRLSKRYFKHIRVGQGRRMLRENSPFALRWKRRRASVTNLSQGYCQEGPHRCCIACAGGFPESVESCRSRRLLRKL